MSLAIILICHSKEESIVFCDSMSSLEALSGFKIKLHLVCGIIKEYTHHLTNSGKIIVVCVIYLVMLTFVSVHVWCRCSIVSWLGHRTCDSMVASSSPSCHVVE